MAVNGPNETLVESNSTIGTLTVCDVVTDAIKSIVCLYDENTTLMTKEQEQVFGFNGLVSVLDLAANLTA